MPAKSTAENPAAKPKATGPDKATLVKAAKLRSEGATWNAIREATGTKLGSSSWFRAWERENIEHIPAGERVKAKPAPAAAEAAKAAKPEKAASAKPKRTVKRSGKANGPRTSNGKKAPVTTRKATAAERQRAGSGATVSS